MIVDLITIKDAALPFDFQIAPGEINLESEEAKITGATRAQGTIKRGIVQTDVEGEIATEIEVECTRCLQPVKKTLEFPFKAAFVTPDFYTQEKETEINADDLEVAVFEGDKIDLSELVREQVLLNLPEQIFCQKDCQGLCAKCGANRNLLNCNCEKEEIDPRWAALRNFK